MEDIKRDAVFSNDLLWENIATSLQPQDIANVRLVSKMTYSSTLRLWGKLRQILYAYSSGEERQDFFNEDRLEQFQNFRFSNFKLVDWRFGGQCDSNQDQFWDRCGGNVRKLELVCPEIVSASKFYSIIVDKCSRLVELSVQFNGGLLTDLEDAPTIVQNRDLRRLRICGYTKMDTLPFWSRIFECFPCVQDLKLDFTVMSDALIELGEALESQAGQRFMAGVVCLDVITGPIRGNRRLRMEKALGSILSVPGLRPNKIGLSVENYQNELLISETLTPQMTTLRELQIHLRGGQLQLGNDVLFPSVTKLSICSDTPIPIALFEKFIALEELDIKYEQPSMHYIRRLLGGRVVGRDDQFWVDIFDPSGCDRRYVCSSLRRFTTSAKRGRNITPVISLRLRSMIFQMFPSAEQMQFLPYMFGQPDHILVH